MKVRGFKPEIPAFPTALLNDSAYGIAAAEKDVRLLDLPLGKQMANPRCRDRRAVLFEQIIARHIHALASTPALKLRQPAGSLGTESEITTHMETRRNPALK